jgi:hypothetical protein
VRWWFSKLPMTEARINALMSADDEANWKEEGLFNEVSDHLAHYDRHPTPARMPFQPFTSPNHQEVLASNSTKPVGDWNVGVSRKHSSG